MGMYKLSNFNLLVLTPSLALISISSASATARDMNHLAKLLLTVVIWEELMSLKRKQEQYVNKSAQTLPELSVNMKVYVQL